ncbi:hypothetical protein FACS1894192_01320 [Bacilli bacterium]|nr:hypothetical protein FACS1894192_01320 [Bacilli bacterium]
MYLKKLDPKTQKEYTKLKPFVSGTWYLKMNEDGTEAKNARGSSLVTCMADEDLRLALADGEFTRVEI